MFPGDLQLCHRGLVLALNLKLSLASFGCHRDLSAFLARRSYNTRPDKVYGWRIEMRDYTLHVFE